MKATTRDPGLDLVSMADAAMDGLLADAVVKLHGRAPSRAMSSAGCSTVSSAPRMASHGSRPGPATESIFRRCPFGARNSEAHSGGHVYGQAEASSR